MVTGKTGSKESRAAGAPNACDPKTARLASFPEMNPNPVMEFGLSGKPTYLNAAAKNAIREAGGIGAFLRLIPNGWKSTRAKLAKAKSLQWEMPVGGKFLLCQASAAQGAVRIFSIDITALKAAEAELRKAEAKWKSLVTSVPDYISILDRRGRFLFLNHYAKGFSEKDVLGTCAYDYMERNNAPIFRKAVERALSTGKIQPINYSAFGDNKSIRFYEGSAIPLGEGGKAESVIIEANDVTDRRKAEEAFRESEEKYRRLVDGSPDAIVSTDFLGRLTSANKAIFYLGYSPTEVIGQHITKFVPASEIPGLLKAFESGLRGKLVSPYPIRIKAKGGGLVPIEVTVNTLESNGKAIGLIGILRDVTARNKAEAALRLSEQRYRAFLDELPDITLILDSRGVMTYVNKAVKRITGYSDAELVGANIATTPILTLKSKATTLKNFALRILGRPVAPYEIELKMKNGEVIPFEVHGQVVELPGGTKGDVVVFRDLRERKMAEKLQNEHHAQLEKEVAERTNELNARLAELEKKNQQLQDFKEFAITREQELMRLREKVKGLDKG